MNRYYSVFEDGETKIRGINVRKRDTLPFIAEAQMSMIRELAKARSTGEFVDKIPSALKEIRHYAEALIRRKVELRQLLITRQISREPYRYARQRRSVTTFFKKGKPH